MLGILNDIEIDNSICIITLDNTDNDKQSICKAETRMFLNAIDDCFGDNWRGQLIEYDRFNRLHDSFSTSRYSFR